MKITKTNKTKIDCNIDSVMVFFDPCYLIGDHNQTWDKVVKLLHKNGNLSRPVTIKFDGMPMLVQGTAYGDGGYQILSDCPQTGTQVGVDAGMIACMDLEDVKQVIEYSKPHMMGKDLDYYFENLIVGIKGLTGKINAQDHDWFSVENSLYLFTR